MKAVGNLRDAQIGRAQQERSLYHQHMVDIVNDRATGDLADYPGQVNGADAESGGVERDVVVLYKVVR